jgi:hypothetical protein
MTWIAHPQDVRRKNLRLGIILVVVFITLCVGSVIFVVIGHYGWRN